MKNKIPYTSYFGSAEELCRKGDAVEFIQPWYTPISTTPENTGMAIGGIGSTFTLTPSGSTPNFSFVPGIFIDCQNDAINFNDFYVSCMELPSLENLEIYDLDEMINYLGYYPAQFNNETLNCESNLTAIEQIRSSIKCGEFYLSNKERFARWNIEFTERTQQEIKLNPSSLTTQILVALDFFNGLLKNGSSVGMSLTANQSGVLPVIDAEQVEYQALYPMAQYRYLAFEGIEVTRKVVSPVVKDDKKLCSLPMHWNHFEVTNNSDKAKVITIVQSLDNLIGSTYRKGRDGVQDSACNLVQNPIAQCHKKVKISDAQTQFEGVHLASESPYASDIEGEVIFGVQADKGLLGSGKLCITAKTSVYTSKSQQQVEAALNTGRVNDHFDHGIYSGREALSAIVCVQIELQPQETVEFRFAQVMDHSKISLNGWESQKAYTQFFAQPDRALNIMQQTLPQLSAIEQAVVDQQQQLLNDAETQIANQGSALRYATMAMNTLSFLAESTVWDREDKFLVKECVDYPFFNSLDVYFYGSFSLLYLLPELDGCVMKAFADAILASDETKRRYWEYEDKPYAELIDTKYEGTRAQRGAVIHDLGSPYDIQPDAYSWHNVKEWKDLAPKYILMVYRHYQRTGNLSIVESCWPAITASIDYLSTLIEEGDALPLTRGTDDTFDNLSSHGISIYCASLWSAGLKVASELAKLMDQEALAQEYFSRSIIGLETLESGLWDEEKGYYHFFVTPIQSKHLTGHGAESLKTLGITITGNPQVDKRALNEYLDEVDLDSSASKLEQRLLKKQRLLEVAPEAFNGSYQDLVEDSDNSFGDALLADTYLKLIGVDCLFDSTRTERALDYLYQHNFELNSPKLGVANMTLADGSPHSAFQAQDVWIGVQFSVATSLKMVGKTLEAERLMDTVYKALYHYAKIPFAAPEGFNCSVSVTADSLCEQFSIDDQTALAWLTQLTATSCLLSDGRVSPAITKDATEFSIFVANCVDSELQTKLHKWLLSTGLKYTAGRYFRPGMIFAYLYR
ncbi:glucosylceramidase [Vibrio tubiashii]|nr:glucosylceramidase [Vibrio tubiashii]